jgi:hypothetical protein
LCIVAEKDAGFGSYTSLDNELAIHGISSIGGLCDEHEGGSSSREEEEGDEHNLQPLRGLPLRLFWSDWGKWGCGIFACGY